MVSASISEYVTAQIASFKGLFVVMKEIENVFHYFCGKVGGSLWSELNNYQEEGCGVTDLAHLLDQ
jgi:hypothetical protein